MPVEPLPPCGDDEPERNAGGPLDDGWEVIPCPQGHPGQTCLEHERYLDALESEATIDPDSGDGGDYDRALDAYDRSQGDG